MGVFRCLWGLGLGDMSILVYAYILMYYTKNRGFENQWFLKERFEVEIFLFLATDFGSYCVCRISYVVRGIY